MVGTVKTDVEIPSAEALGLVPHEKSQSSAIGKSAREKKFRLEPGIHGFNELGLAAEVDMLKLNRAVEGNYSVSIPKETRPNSIVLRRKIAENYLAEIFHFREFQKYKAKITPEFIALFNPAEQAFLRNMLQILENHLEIHEKYVEQLLSLLNYPNTDALVADLTAIDEVKEAIEKGTYKEDDTRFSKLVKIAGLKKEPIAKYLAEKLKGDMPVDPTLSPQINEEVAIYLKSVGDYVKGASESLVRLFAYARVFDNVLLYYSRSTLPEDAERKKHCAQGQGSHASSDLSNTIKDMILNRRLLPFGEMATMIDEEWAHPNGEKISTIVQGFRTEVARNAEQLQEIMGDMYATSTMLRAPRVGEERPAQTDFDIELEEEVAIIAVEPDSPSKSKLKGAKSESELQARKAQIEPRPKRTSSLKRLSMMLGHKAEVATAKFKSVARVVKKDQAPVWTKSERNYLLKDSKSADLRAEVGFLEFADFVLDKVKAYKSVAEDMKADDGAELADRRIAGWDFVYSRNGMELKNAMPQDGFKKGDDIKVLHHEEHVFTVMPEKVHEDDAEGISVVVHRHEPEDMYLAVQVMVEAMAKMGKKEICISLGPDATLESEGLILTYARVILSQNAIPIIMIGERELSREESKQKLQQIADRSVQNGKQPTSKTAISEWYSAEVARIEQIQKEDKKHLKELDSGIAAVKSVDSKDDPHNIIANRIASLIKISLVNRNLTEEDLIKRIVSCVKSYLDGEDGEKEIRIDKISEIERKLLFELRRSLAEDLGREGSELLIDTLKAKLFTLALINLEDYVFLQAVDALLEQLEAPSFTEEEITMRDPNTGKTLNPNEILIRLAEIALISRNMAESEFTHKFILLGLKLNLFPEYVAEQSLSDILIDHLNGLVQKRIAQYRAKSETSVGKLVSDLLDLLKKMQQKPNLDKIVSQSVESQKFESDAEKQNDIAVPLEDSVAFFEKLTQLPDGIDGIAALTQKEAIEMALAPEQNREDIENSRAEANAQAQNNPDTDSLLIKIDNILGNVVVQPITQSTVEAQDNLDALLVEIDSLLGNLPQTAENASDVMQDKDPIQKQEIIAREVVEESAPEVVNLTIQLVHPEFYARIAALHEKRANIGSDRRFVRALAAYAVFLREIQYGNSDLAKELIPRIALIIEDAEKPLTGRAKHSGFSIEYENLLQKASAVNLDSKAKKDPLHAFCEEILVQELEERQQLRELIEKAEKPVSEDPVDEVEFFDLENPSPNHANVSNKSESEEVDDLIKALDDEIAAVYSDKPDVAAPATRALSKGAGLSFFGNGAAIANANKTTPTLAVSPTVNKETPEESTREAAHRADGP